MKKKTKTAIEAKTEILFILDEETKFLSDKVDTKKCIIITSQTELDAFLSKNFQVKSIVILVELDWGNPVSQFYGYKIAKELIENSPNRLSNFNLLFISTLSRMILYQIIKDSNSVFVKSFEHTRIDQSFCLKELHVPTISYRKFDYLKKYCLTQSGILDKLEHVLRPNKVLSNSKIEDLLCQIKANADIVGFTMMAVINKTDVNNFNQNRWTLYEQLILRIREVIGEQDLKHKVRKNDKGESWKPQMLLLEDDNDQLYKIKRFFDDDFEVIPKNNGKDAIEYLKDNSDQTSVAICDMELLQQQNNNFDQDIQGIDVIEYIKENHPHIVIKVISHLPRRGLHMLLGDILNVSDLKYKSMLLEGNSDFISDLVTEIQREIDLRRTFQRLRGPSNTLWGNFSRNGKQPGGRLKQFYYDLRAIHNKEFEQMWEEIDIIIEKVLKEENKINSQFPQVGKRNEIAEMPLQKSLGYLRELLINRMFWIKKLYSGSQEEKVSFEDYKKYFGEKFLLFSTDAKRINQYASLTGFSIRMNLFDNHFLKFNQFLEEELSRIKESDTKSNFDLSNSDLIVGLYDILKIIVNAGAQANFTKKNYPEPKVFWESKDQKSLVENTLEQLTKEKPSSQLISVPESREKIWRILSNLKITNEFHIYPQGIKESISKAQEILHTGMEED